MTDNKLEQNRRLGLQEANKMILFLDNFFWILSSFWMAGTGVVISKAISCNGVDNQIVMICIATIVAWILYLFFLQNTWKKSLFYIGRANYFEDELKIDILPYDKVSDGHKNKSNGDEDKNISTCALKIPNIFKFGIPFRVIMVIMACSSIAIMCIFICAHIKI